MRQPDFSWTRDFVAGAVALAAIGLAVWEGWENRVHNRLSVVPKLDAGRNFDMVSQSFQLELVSTGLGPAVVRDSWLYVDRERIYHSGSGSEFPWQGAYDLFGRGFSISDAYFGEGAYLIPGETYRFLDVRRDPDSERVDDFRGIANRIDVVTCYCSVYGDACRVEHAGINDVPAPPCHEGAGQRCPRFPSRRADAAAGPGFGTGSSRSRVYHSPNPIVQDCCCDARQPE